jgi:hypothetical protein
MSIFEDKKHNNGKYVGQKPVSATPDELRGNTWGNFSRNVEWPHEVKHVPNSDAGENK